MNGPGWVDDDSVGGDSEHGGGSGGADSEGSHDFPGGASREEYKAKVVAELADRERQLSVIDRKIAEIESKLEDSSSKAGFRQGNALKISSAESFRSSLRKSLKRRQTERVAILDGIKRAKERLSLIEEES